MSDESLEMCEGTLVRGFGGFYVAADASGTEHTLRCKKKFRRMKLSPLVGDQVLFTPGEGEEHGWLEEILPRRSECLRPPVANVSLLLISVSPTPAPPRPRKCWSRCALKRMLRPSPGMPELM